MSVKYLPRLARTLKFIAFSSMLFAVSGCDAQTPPNVATGSQIKIETSKVPARYTAALPSTISGMQTWSNGSEKFPPLAHVVDNLAFGEPDMFRRLVTASKLVPIADRRGWAELWYDHLRFHISSPEFCSLARPAMSGPESVVRMAIAGSFIKNCTKPQDRSLVLRKDTPDMAVLDYFNAYNSDESEVIEREYDDRLAVAAENMIINGKHYDVGPAAFILVDQKDHRGEIALLSIYRRLTDPKRKDEVAMAFLRGKNPEGQRIAQEACLRQKTDLMCSNSNPLAGFVPGDDPKTPGISAIESRKKQLIEMGFPNVSRINAATIASDSSDFLLMESGYGYGFDVETGQFPNEHDTLLRNLAKLIAPSLNGIIFEEIYPQNDQGPYELRAYLKGKKYYTQARNLEDWYDVDAVLKLLDAVIADQKLKLSLIPLQTEDQTLIIMGGPTPAIERALKAGLIRRGDVGRAEQLGKDFENETFQTLNKTGAELKRNVRVSPTPSPTDNDDQ